MLKSLLSSIFVPGAIVVIRSALVTGAVAALAVLISDIGGIINVDVLGGILVTAVAAGLKALQKILSGE